MTFVETVTLFSALTAVILYFLGYCERLRFERRQNTVTLMTKIYESGPLFESQIQFVQWIADGKIFDHDDLDEHEERIIVPMLEYYDFLASASLNNSLDRKIVLTHRGAAMKATFKVVQEYIIKRRLRLGRPQLYAPYEKFVSTVIKEKDF